jgi:hypothetical protein
MDQPKPRGRDKLVKGDVNLAVDLLNAGASLEEVQVRLLDRGLDEETAAATIRGLLMPALYNEAKALLNNGSSRRQVEERLVNKGLDPLVAKAVINNKVVSQAQPEARPTEGIGQIRHVLGVFIFIIGIGLLLGNITRQFPSFPLAGFIVMCVGGIIYKGGKWSGS